MIKVGGEMSMPISARTRANRANAAKSTGPRTPQGKSTVAQNARQHGLSGGFSILTHENPDEFQKCLDEYRAEFKPTSPDETRLVEHMTQARWTLDRALRIEAHLLNSFTGVDFPLDDPDAAIAAQ